MNAIKKMAQSKKSAFFEARSASITELKRTITHLQAALSEREASEAERTANIKKVKAIMNKLGLDHEDLREAKKPTKKAQKKESTRASGARRGPKPGRKIKPKYTLKSGRKAHSWSGRGRMPLVFKDFVESGGKLERCLIRSNESGTS